MAVRDLATRDQESFAYVVGWMEDWRQRQNLEMGRDAARRWWKEVIQAEKREEWQLRQWQEGTRWFLNWFGIYQMAGVDARGIAERLKCAVQQVGARRGLAIRTRNYSKPDF